MKRGLLKENLALVGPGRAGRAFARSWRAAGGSIAAVVGRDLRSAEKGAAELGGAPAALLDFGGTCDILMITVPDDAIPQVASELARRVSCRFAFHLSGALAGEVLAPLRSVEAQVGSLHPLRVFAGSPGEDWRGAFVAVEGDPQAAAAGEELARAVGARPHRLDSKSKPLYHAAATLAAGGTAALLSLAARAWAEAGLPEEEARKALAELAERAANAVRQHPFEKAFTGPIARRDSGTVRAHCNALADRKEVYRVYVALAEETLRRTASRGKEEEIRSLLRTPPSPSGRGRG